MSDSSLYALGLLVPREIAREIDVVRSRYHGRHFHTTVPHVTLKQPFTPLASLGEVEAAARAVAARTPPLIVSLRGIGCFRHPGWNVLFIGVARRLDLLRCQRRLVEALHGLVGHLEPYSVRQEIAGFVPHVTLGQEMESEGLDRALQELRSYRPAYCFQASDLVLARRDDDGVWRTRATFPFLGGAAGT